MKENKIQLAIDAWISGLGPHQLIHALPAMRKVWKKLAKQENDYRSGWETYGYDTINTDMLYISDRWKAAFRLRWLIDGVESGMID